MPHLTWRRNQGQLHRALLLTLPRRTRVPHKTRQLQPRPTGRQVRPKSPKRKGVLHRRRRACSQMQRKRQLFRQRLCTAPPLQPTVRPERVSQTKQVGAAPHLTYLRPNPKVDGHGIMCVVCPVTPYSQHAGLLCSPCYRFPHCAAPLPLVYARCAAHASSNTLSQPASIVAADTGNVGPSVARIVAADTSNVGSSVRLPTSVLLCPVHVQHCEA